MPGTPLFSRRNRSKRSVKPFALRKAADAFGHVGERALRLAHREQAELPEAVARNGREKVRIAAAGVEHRCIGGTLYRAAARGLDQFVLQFERAERRKAGLSHVALFLAAFLFCHDAFSNEK